MGCQVFDEWCNERDIFVPVMQMAKHDLNESISRFVHKAIKKDGENLTHLTLYI